MRCPLCNSKRHRPHPDPTFVVCSGCAETLRPNELVKWATRWTRRRYCRTNFASTTYPGA